MTKNKDKINAFYFFGIKVNARAKAYKMEKYKILRWCSFVDTRLWFISI
tara:strand:- start:87081 stop:87227 length:147 start_codon:yes stop_codon:yes gene_type:complete